MVKHNGRTLVAAALLGSVLALGADPASAAKTTECTKINMCYCINGDLRSTIDDKVARARQLLAEQRKAGKLIGYMSVPLSPAGGGNLDVNTEVANSAAEAIVRRFGADQVFVLNPTMKDFEIANGAGTDYMLMWTTLLEGPNGLGEDLDFAYFVGPQDFARFFKLNGSADMAKIDAFFDERARTNAGFAKAVKEGLSKTAFRNYYALKASTAFSRGSHDEWNIVRTVNERRRTDPKYGIANQLPVLFDGQGIVPSGWETSVADGYVGKCAP